MKKSKLTNEAPSGPSKEEMVDSHARMFAEEMTRNHPDVKRIKEGFHKSFKRAVQMTLKGEKNF